MGERSGKAESGIFVPVEEVEMTWFLGKVGQPNGDVAHQLLHTHGHHDRSTNLVAKRLDQ